MSLIRASANIGSFTLLSRILGFVRDQLIAKFLGVGALSDAFFVAFKIPNFMRQLFAEGAFNAAFVPLYAGTRATQGEAVARALAKEVHAALLLVLIVVSVLGVVFMPELMMVLAPGFAEDPEKYKLTVLLTRITFPYILFISLVSLQGGILNSVGKYSAVAATPVLMNICLIAAMFTIDKLTPTMAHALAIGVIISGVMQYLWLLYHCRRAGESIGFMWPKITANVRRLLSIVWPVALGSSVTQINLIINTIIASLFVDAVSILYYAVRIEELPFGVIGIAVSTALLPMLSRQIREGKIAQAMHSQNRALELALLFGVPAAVALFVIPTPIISVIYERGAFTAANTSATSVALIAYAIGLPASLAAKIFSSTFYANQDTKTPVRIAMICVGVNLALTLLFLWPFGYVGLALSISIANWVNAILLAKGLHKNALFIPDMMLRFRLPRVVFASTLMGLALWGAMLVLAPYFHFSLLLKILSLTALIGLGCAVYGVSLLMLRVAKPSELKGYFKRS
jgi:putative peptidoglycan lipid II flippase